MGSQYTEQLPHGPIGGVVHDHVIGDLTPLGLLPSSQLQPAGDVLLIVTPGP